ncbi:uncharacterized protein LOC114322265 [Camellia sinensis]|uniref:uncharacterized protein LOC114322265 n=1 Tax=Camellia sinensis TaxID=4442 RepID=UPI001036AE68|nr:uncharacterized protein LOC114322265 [Camellia sinensis]
MDENNSDDNQETKMWTPRIETKLINMLRDEIRNNQTTGRTTSWTIRHWNHYANQLHNMYGFRYTGKQVCQKYQRLKVDYQTFKRLQAETGLGWDPIIGTVVAPDEFWDKARRNMKKFRTKGFEYFQEMAEIAENCCATGALSRASTQGALDLEEEDDMLNKFWNPDVDGSNAGGSNATEAILVDLFEDEYIDPAKGKSHKRGPTTSQTDSGRSKKSRSSGFDDVCIAFTSYVQAKTGHSRARENETEAVSAGGDDYSLDACQDALLELGDIPPLQYVRALTLFKDKEWRRQNHMSSDRENNTMEISSEDDEDCVGAIDGTLVDAWVPTPRQNTFRGRKATVSQNVLAACDFDMLFTFIKSGWEGSAHDNAILVDSITRADLQFPHPPNGKYYLVDVGFTNMPGFLAPFRSQRYHLQEFRGCRYAGPKELFNHRHSSLHNVIERTFGVLKKRFPILRSMPNYKSTRQRPLVIACCVVHNWIRLHAAMELFFMEADNEMAAEAEVDGLAGDQAEYVDMSQHGLTYQSNVRDEIATAMWQNHVSDG